MTEYETRTRWALAVGGLLLGVACRDWSFMKDHTTDRRGSAGRQPDAAGQAGGERVDVSDAASDKGGAGDALGPAESLEVGRRGAHDAGGIGGAADGGGGGYGAAGSAEGEPPLAGGGATIEGGNAGAVGSTGLGALAGSVASADSGGSTGSGGGSFNTVPSKGGALDGGSAARGGVPGHPPTDGQAGGGGAPQAAGGTVNAGYGGLGGSQTTDVVLTGRAGAPGAAPDEPWAHWTDITGDLGQDATWLKANAWSTRLIATRRDIDILDVFALVAGDGGAGTLFWLRHRGPSGESGFAVSQTGVIDWKRISERDRLGADALAAAPCGASVSVLTAHPNKVGLLTKAFDLPTSEGGSEPREPAALEFGTLIGAVYGGITAFQACGATCLNVLARSPSGELGYWRRDADGWSERAAITNGVGSDVAAIERSSHITLFWRDGSTGHICAWQDADLYAPLDVWDSRPECETGPSVPMGGKVLALTENVVLAQASDTEFLSCRYVSPSIAQVAGLAPGYSEPRRWPGWLGGAEVGALRGRPFLFSVGHHGVVQVHSWTGSGAPTAESLVTEGLQAEDELGGRATSVAVGWLDRLNLDTIDVFGIDRSTGRIWWRIWPGIDE